jgi:hypothetical protein
VICLAISSDSDRSEARVAAMDGVALNMTFLSSRKCSRQIH